MKKLALLTPWPPQHSGIADYAYDLAKVLSSPSLAVVVYTTEKKPRSLAGIDIISIEEQSDFAQLDDFDCVVYQLGNNSEFHLWMIPLLHRHPGIIHLHDLVMHHIAAWLTWLQGDAEAYLNLMNKWYGATAVLEATRSLEQEEYIWNSDRVAEFPLCEEYLQDARAIIVHSDYALGHVRSTASQVPSFNLPQLYDLKPKARASQRIQRISVLGGVDPQKRLDWVIGAIGCIQDSIAANGPIELHVVGAIDPRCIKLQEEAKRLNRTNLKVIFHGRVTELRFIELFECTDLCVALRYPTMGETSAIVMKALQLGIPTIVNDIGWYAELPAGIVKKLPVSECEQALGNLLEYLVVEKGAYEEWSARCFNYAKTAFSLQEYGANYLEICSNPEGEELVTDIFSWVFAECGMDGSDEEDGVLDKLLDESYF